MLEYIYFVKCPGCEDEHFDFFNDAKDFAMGCLAQRPIITQIEVDRNDFGECVDSCDLGTVWSWEEAMETKDEPAVSVFTKDDLKHCDCGDKCKCGHHHEDPEFAALDNSVDFVPADTKKPVPADMSIQDLVEAMEENEDTVECAGCEELFPKNDCFYKEDIGWLCGDCEDRVVKCSWCDELFDKSECRNEVDLGWLCDRCQAGIMSRGEQLTFRENSYWDFLDESIDLTEGYANLVNLPDAKELVIFELAKDPAIGKYLDLNNVSVKPTVAKINGSFDPVGHVIDFDFNNGNITVSLQRPNGKVNVVDIDKLISAGFFTKPMQRSCPAYALLTAIKKAASALNKAHAPTKAQRAAQRATAKDANILGMLQKNPGVAEEFRNHIESIRFSIPLGDYWDAIPDDEPDAEAALNRLNKTKDDFLALPFAKAAIAKGIVDDRQLFNEEGDLNDNDYGCVARFWYGSCLIKLDCALSALSADAQNIYAASKNDGMITRKKAEAEPNKAAKKPEDSGRLEGYVLAKALITYFDNDVEFYKHKPAATNQTTTTPAAATPITEAFKPTEKVEFEYDGLKVTLQGPKRAEDDWDEAEDTVSYSYYRTKEDVAVDIWDNFIKEDDAKDYEGGLEALEDDKVWEDFLSKHFDDLLDKYYDKLLKYYEDDARKEYEEKHSLGESMQKPFLEEFDDAETHKAALTDCPECGATSYDMKEQYCSNCGFNL